MLGFTMMAEAIAQDGGYPGLRVVTYPGTIATHEEPTIRKNVQESLIDQVFKALTEPVEKSARKAVSEPNDRDIVFKGTSDEVNKFFYENQWTDGLPVVPPTIERVQEFLKYTDRSPNEVIGVLPPRMAEATVWKVAVNGVMAGCRPEYMPILLAIVEVMADPKYGLMHGGSTPGWEAMIILNGPIRDQLAFNYEIAVQRPGRQANTSIGRFYRLFVRNVPRFLPASTDMGTFGHMFRAVVPENDQACKKLGWKTLSEQQGFKPGDNVVTITSIRAISDPIATTGEKAEHHLDYLTDWAKRMIEPYESASEYVETHVLVMSPIVAAVLAKGGYSKEAVIKYLEDHMVVPASYFEQAVNWSTDRPYNLCDDVKAGKMPKAWCLSTDPNRMVPLLLPDSKILLIVTGDPTRNRSTFYRQNFVQGYATSKLIKLPANWDKLIKDLGK